MKKNLKILVATDYSEAASNTVKYALQFALETHSEITFLHVNESFKVYPKEFSSIEKLEHVSVEFETRELEQHVEEISNVLQNDVKKITIKYFVRQGKASQVICEEAIIQNMDIIFVGTHGNTSFHQVFLGSHTWDVINQAEIPVLAIPKDAVYSGIHHFLFATEYRSTELPAIKFLLKWNKYFKSELVIFHVCNDVFSEEFEAELLTKFENDIKNNLPNEKINIRIIYNDDLVTGINTFCSKAPPGWLIMCPEKSHLFEKVFNPLMSTTKKMSFYTHVPLLTIPDYDNPENQNFWNKIKEESAL